MVKIYRGKTKIIKFKNRHYLPKNKANYDKDIYNKIVIYLDDDIKNFNLNLLGLKENDEVMIYDDEEKLFNIMINIPREFIFLIKKSNFKYNYIIENSILYGIRVKIIDLDYNNNYVLDFNYNLDLCYNPLFQYFENNSNSIVIKTEKIYNRYLNKLYSYKEYKDYKDYYLKEYIINKSYDKIIKVNKALKHELKDILYKISLNEGRIIIKDENDYNFNEIEKFVKKFGYPLNIPVNASIDEKFIPNELRITNNSNNYSGTTFNSYYEKEDYNINFTKEELNILISNKIKIKELNNINKRILLINYYYINYLLEEGIYEEFINQNNFIKCKCNNFIRVNPEEKFNECEVCNTKYINYINDVKDLTLYSYKEVKVYLKENNINNKRIINYINNYYKIK